MTTNVVTDDQRQKPTPEQVDTYTRRIHELTQRYLKGVLDIPAALVGIQELMEMTGEFINCNVQPETPSWADQKNPIIQHLPCGMVDPARLTTASVFKEGEDVLGGEMFIARAQKLDSMNACAFDFYAKPENWKYLPKDADVIVFTKTVFRHSGGGRGARFLLRDGSEWDRHYGWLNGGFSRFFRVAVLTPVAEQCSLRDRQVGP